MSGFWVGLFVIGFLCAGAAYLLAIKLRLMALVDLVWTSGLGLGAWAYFVYSGGGGPRAFVVVALVSLWSFRLSYHLLKDRILKGEEDPRYKNLAEHWGEHSSRNFGLLFMAQIVFIAAFLFPISIALQNPVQGWQITDTLAILIATIALGGEALADKQLADFRANPSNKKGVCRRGLWRYTRHPNYFFEWVHWWAYVAFAWGASNFGWALVGPLAMFIFLRFITGVPPAEYSSIKSRGDAYREYQKTTNAFFPWIPQKQAS